MTRAMPSTMPRRVASWDGRRSAASSAGWTRRFAGTWSMRPGGRRSAPAATPAGGWGSAGRRPMAPKLLVTGAKGQLGRELLRRAPRQDVAMAARSRAELDITDAAAVGRALDETAA